jgi:1-deoxy-D-xylulose-5-phosphate synthase
MEFDVPVVRVGWPDQFIEHGKLEELREKYGLTAEAALEKARPYLVAMESRRMALR